MGQTDAPTLAEQPPRDIVIVRNGIVKVSSDELEYVEGDHPELLTPVRLPVMYDPRAKCPAFKDYLRTSVRNRELIQLLREIVGYLLVPDNRQQKAFLNIGPPGAGKSTLQHVIVELLGRRNCSARPLHDFASDRFATYDLFGKLLNASADLSSRELKSSRRFREITGGDPIQAEQKHQSAFMFTPFARLMFSANKNPTLADPTPAMFARWVVIPWRYEFRGTPDEDKDLKDKLTTPSELSGILNWALVGLQRLMRQGSFSRASLADRALQAFRQEADLVRVFFEETDLPSKIKRQNLYMKYQSWCQRTGHIAMGSTTFYARAREVIGNDRKTGQGDWFFFP